MVQYGPSTLVDTEQVAGLHVVVALLSNAPARVGSTPIIDNPKWIAADSKVLVEPVTAARCSRNQSARDVFQLAHLVGFTAFPWGWPDFDRPVVRIALPAQTHQHRP